LYLLATGPFNIGRGLGAHLGSTPLVARFRSLFRAGDAHSMGSIPLFQVPCLARLKGGFRFGSGRGPVESTIRRSGEPGVPASCFPTVRFAEVSAGVQGPSVS